MCISNNQEYGIVVCEGSVVYKLEKRKGTETFQILSFFNDKKINICVCLEGVFFCGSLSNQSKEDDRIYSCNNQNFAKEMELNLESRVVLFYGASHSLYLILGILFLFLFFD